VEGAHKEVEKGTWSVNNVEVSEGTYTECGMWGRDCWLEVKERAEKKGCRCRRVVTDSVAAILAIGPDIDCKREGREGGRRGAGRSEIEPFAGQQFGSIAICRVWRTFGWVGMSDIREAIVDRVRVRYEGRLRTLTQQMGAEMEGFSKRKELQGVREGKIGGRTGPGRG